MSKTLIVETPINSLSFGNVGTNVLRGLWKAGVDVAFYPNNDSVDLEAFDKIGSEFINWLRDSSNNRHRKIDRDTPSFKLWHINGSEKSVGRNTYLYTFHETSYGTDYERRLLDLHEHVFFSSTYSQEVFEGINPSTSVLPLGFDPDFHKTHKKYYGDDVIHFGLTGKFENRKHTSRLIQLWIAKFGNNPKYRLTTLVYNNFLTEQENNFFLQSSLGKEKPFNVQNFKRVKTNSDVNDFINSIDIELSGLSGAEGWNLPAFNATALGKWCPVMNHTAHKEWATKNNCILIEPDNTYPIYDNKFFIKGQDFNQGDFYGFNEDKVSDAMDQAVEMAKTPNPEGEKLQQDFSYRQMVNQIIDTVGVG